MLYDPPCNEFISRDEYKIVCSKHGAVNLIHCARRCESLSKKECVKMEKSFRDDFAAAYEKHKKENKECGGCKDKERKNDIRSSCMECVEKHLGAAWVLLAEMKDGHSSRLRAIGHLHEAEDESQAWPEIHNTIREARKLFQSKGVIPDFEALAELISPQRPIPPNSTRL